MKKVILSLAVIAALGSISCKNETKKETTNAVIAKGMAMKEVSFGVRGNCGMCKKTIEKAANNVQGVASAIWDVDKKTIDVSFDAAKTDIMEIHKAIATSGYDTEKAEASVSAYENLPGCCQYDHDMQIN